MITFFAALPAATGEYELGEDAAHHATVRRIAAGEAVNVIDGRGGRRTGTIASVSKKKLLVRIEKADQDPRPAEIHLFVPVADKDRTLWLAEKAAELQATSWTPVMYQRSKSVSPRGEGEGFIEKVRSRMTGALEQSGGSWLPELRPMIEPDAMGTAGKQVGVVLDPAGDPLAGHSCLISGLSIAVGPEGGFEPAEITMLRDSGWRAASIGATTLRFETAAIAALAIARAWLAR